MSFTGTYKHNVTRVINPIPCHRTNKGLQYMADYREFMTEQEEKMWYGDRSLVDKGYMDDTLGIPKYVVGHDPYPGDLVTATALALMAQQHVDNKS